MAVVNGGDSILGSFGLKTRYQVSFRDALVIHAAQSAGTQVLYSEDLSDGQLYGPVRVINPFMNHVVECVGCIDEQRQPEHRTRNAGWKGSA